MRFIQCTIPMNLLYFDVLWITICLLSCSFGNTGPSSYSLYGVMFVLFSAMFYTVA
jgi:hypothetical protein